MASWTAPVWRGSSDGVSPKAKAGMEARPVSETGRMAFWVVAAALSPASMNRVDGFITAEYARPFPPATGARRRPRRADRLPG